VVRGIALSATTWCAAPSIMALMCQGRVGSSSRSSSAHLIDLRRTRRRGSSGSRRWPSRAWSRSSRARSRSTAAGWYVVRAVAMVFDRYLQTTKLRETLLAHHLCDQASWTCR
jgi:oxygen-independent coproporphyrinogen-3 oxidase